MATHRFQPTHYHTTIGSHEPVLHIADGDTVITTTVDARGHDASDKQVTESGNPQTGPFYVEGAEPGDTLVVHLDHLYPNRDTGFSATVVAPHVVDPRAVRTLPDGPDGEWRIDRTQGMATLIAPETKLGHLTLPLAPMLGCFGVAPPRRQAISTATSGPYGGNMDYRGFVAGVTVYFPVFVPGALLHVGDGHAVQGDGEIVGTGIEVSFDVQFTVQLLKGHRIDWPAARIGTTSSAWAMRARSTRPCSTRPPRWAGGWSTIMGWKCSLQVSCWDSAWSTMSAMSSTRPTPWYAKYPSGYFQRERDVSVPFDWRNRLPPPYAPFPGDPRKIEEQPGRPSSRRWAESCWGWIPGNRGPCLL